MEIWETINFLEQAFRLEILPKLDSGSQLDQRTRLEATKALSVRFGLNKYPAMKYGGELTVPDGMPDGYLRLGPHIDINKIVGPQVIGEKPQSEEDGSDSNEETPDISSDEEEVSEYQPEDPEVEDPLRLKRKQPVRITAGKRRRILTGQSAFSIFPGTDKRVEPTEHERARLDEAMAMSKDEKLDLILSQMCEFSLFLECFAKHVLL